MYFVQVKGRTNYETRLACNNGLNVRVANQKDLWIICLIFCGINYMLNCLGSVSFICKILTQ